MPDMYRGHEYDLCGSVAALAKPSQLLPKTHLIKAGDALVGLASSGFHSNGFSLIRRLLGRLYPADKDPSLSKLEELRRHCMRETPFASSHEKIGDLLLEPTRIYVEHVLPLIEKELISAAAHITGGGLPRNVARVLPDGLGAILDATKWPTLPVFSWIAGTGEILDSDMQTSLNLGLGMVLAVAQENVKDVLAQLESTGEKAFVVGKVVPHTEGARIVIDGMETFHKPIA